MDVTTVLIAVDDTATSIKVAETAHRLFGDDARYLVINVGPVPYQQMTWGYAYPLMAPYGPQWSYDVAGERVELSTSESLAERHAADVAEDASLPKAIPIGEVGDPATAILRAASEHDADVIAVGSHHRSWLSRLFTGSVEHDVVHDADRPVLVVK